jgi:hypothetical protein
VEQPGINIQQYVIGTKTGGKGDRTAVGVQLPDREERWLTSEAYESLKETQHGTMDDLAAAVDGAKVWQDPTGGRSELDEQVNDFNINRDAGDRDAKGPE